jgi:hypothetical protein
MAGTGYQFINEDLMHASRDIPAQPVPDLIR